MAIHCWHSFGDSSPSAITAALFLEPELAARSLERVADAKQPFLGASVPMRWLIQPSADQRGSRLFLGKTSEFFRDDAPDVVLGSSPCDEWEDDRDASFRDPFCDFVCHVIGHENPRSHYDPSEHFLSDVVTLPRISR